ncbi:MAG: adenosylcobinamide-GDP ribazoletransferase [Nitratireductor sp.]|nr:adenosylcobinamide-GDP ribazoletransferase [Nitratireductor sp.]
MAGLAASFLQAMGFFTRLPVPATGNSELPRLNDSAIMFTFAGLAIGLVIGLAWFVAAHLLPPLPAAGVAIAAGMLLTGALHEDGLSDTADGLGGGHGRERALEIMRDSRIGAYGAAALIVSIGLRWTALAEFTPLQGLFALAAVHMTSRTAILQALAFSRYARDKGLGSTVSDGVSQSTFWIAAAAAVLLSGAITGPAGWIAAAIGLFAARIMLAWLERRLGGYTGDGLGAMEQVAEITTLLVIAGLAA